MLFSIGLTLRLPVRKNVPIIVPAVAIRTILVPLIMVSGTAWLIDDPVVEKAAMLETSMPTMMLTMVFAERYGLDTEALAQAILASTIVSFFTLPMMMAVLAIVLGQ
jgi:predicted permease